MSWIDLLVIAATVLTFGAVVAASQPQARSQSWANPLITGLPAPSQQISDDPGLIKARIRLATGRWT